MDQETLLTLDPQQVRVRVSVPPKVVLNTSTLKLSLGVTEGTGVSESVPLGLALLSEASSVRPGGLFHSDYPVTSYDLALDADAVDHIRHLQSTLRPATHTKVSLGFSWDLVSIPTDATSIRLWVDLRLRQSEAYMVLFDGADVEITREGS
jgi:hypothetical protein